MRIAITGANSSVGKALLTQAVARGDFDARAGVRRREAITTLPSDPRVTPCLVSFDDPDSLSALLEGVSCLVHLPGVLIESRHSTYQTANVNATRAVVEACQQANVSHIVFISSLGADTDSVNRYYRSKGLAEQVVTNAGISATIIRTPILLGPGTAGAQSLVGIASRPAVKVLGGGHYSLRPLDVSDLCDAILNSSLTQRAGVAVHGLVGPEVVTHRDLITTTGRLMGHNVSVGAVPIWAAKLGATLAGWFRAGGMTATVIDVITAEETVHTNADVDLGVSLTPLSATLEKLLPERTGPRD